MYARKEAYFLTTHPIVATSAPTYGPLLQAAIGQTGLCQKQHDAKGCFAGETVEAHFDKEVPAESEGEEGWGLRSWKRLMLDLDKEHTKIALGTVSSGKLQG
jgi:hypothetical protein